VEDFAKNGTTNLHTSIPEDQDGEKTRELMEDTTTAETQIMKVIPFGVIPPIARRDGNIVIQSHWIAPMPVLVLKIHFPASKSNATLIQTTPTLLKPSKRIKKPMKLDKKLKNP
jgi:hypothetical protein